MEFNNLIGKRWVDISQAERDSLLSCKVAVSGVSGVVVGAGDCLVSFRGYDFSIQGFAVNRNDGFEITIDDDSIFYGPKV